MAYQNVGTPRFYINVYEWANTIGINVTSYPPLNPIYNTLPVNPVPFWDFTSDTSSINLQDLQDYVPSSENPSGTYDDESNINTHPCFVAILGHDFTDMIYTHGQVNSVGIVNGDPSSGYKGFTIYRTKELVHKVFLDSGGTGNAGSVIIGVVYDMPHSPDLALTMTREMDGVKKIRTKGGADLVYHKYIKPAMWGGAGAWELYESDADPNYQSMARSGRRIWDLSFSYLQESDVFPMLSSLTPFESTSDSDEVYSDNTDWHEGETLLDDNTFYNQVIHKTNGGQLPFVFQPNKNDNTNFAICKFDQSSFKFDQVANGVYNCKMKIREVW